MALEWRGISQVLLAEHIGCSRETLRRLEAASPSVAVGTALRALRVISLDNDIDRLAEDAGLKSKLDNLARLGIEGGRSGVSSRLRQTS